MYGLVFHPNLISVLVFKTGQPFILLYFLMLYPHYRKSAYCILLGQSIYYKPHNNIFLNYYIRFMPPLFFKKL